jgi:hypothetical protein
MSGVVSRSPEFVPADYPCRRHADSRVDEGIRIIDLRHEQLAAHVRRAR